MSSHSLIWTYWLVFDFLLHISSFQIVLLKWCLLYVFIKKTCCKNNLKYKNTHYTFLFWHSSSISFRSSLSLYILLSLKNWNWFFWSKYNSLFIVIHQVFFFSKVSNFIVIVFWLLVCFDSMSDARYKIRSG